MDKREFDIIMKFYNISNDLYFELEKLLGTEKAEELLDGFTDYTESLLKVGKHSDIESLSDKEGFLTKAYEGLPSYLKLIVVYEYENGYSLCETTSGLLKLIPNELISFEKKGSETLR